MVLKKIFSGQVAKLENRKGLKIPYIRNAVGSNPTLPTIF